MSLTRALLPALLVTAIGGPALAGVAPLQLSAIVDSTTATATFSILFDSVPDLYSAPFGAQADSFQYYVHSTKSDFLYGDFSSPPDAGETVIRGENLHHGLGLPIVWSNTSDPGPIENGGWGPTHSFVGIRQSGALVSFDVPLAELQDDDGLFWYMFGTYSYGSTIYAEGFQRFQSGIVHTIAAVPEPSAYALMLAGLGLVGYAAARRNAGSNRPSPATELFFQDRTFGRFAGMLRA